MSKFTLCIECEKSWPVTPVATAAALIIEGRRAEVSFIEMESMLRLFFPQLYEYAKAQWRANDLESLEETIDALADHVEMLRGLVGREKESRENRPNLIFTPSNNLSFDTDRGER